MEIVNQRIGTGNDSTLGALYIDGKLSAFVVEDEDRAEKLKGETRIPAGRYKLVVRKSLSPLTEKYRNRFGWFSYHIMLEDVPGFEYIYIHVGNFESETEGCQLIGLSGNIVNGEFSNSNSVKAYEEFYKEVYPRLERGEDVFYTVKNEIDHGRN